MRFVVVETKELKRKVYYRANEDQVWQLFRESNADEGGLQPLASLITQFTSVIRPTLILPAFTCMTSMMGPRL